MIRSLWGAVLAPTLFMPIVYLIGRRIGKNVSWVAFIPLAYSVASIMSFMPTVPLGPLGEYFYWLPEIRFGLLLDGLSFPIVLTVAIRVLPVLRADDNPLLGVDQHIRIR